jgi:hypothetical protein
MERREKCFPLPGLELRPYNHPSRIQSLYRLSYLMQFSVQRTLLEKENITNRLSFLQSIRVARINMKFAKPLPRKLNLI